MQSQRSLGSSWYERLPHPDQSLSGVKHGEVHTLLGAGTCMKSAHSPPHKHIASARFHLGDKGKVSVVLLALDTKT
jgi:hypothetical protein